nr:hypothetical protein [Bovine gammaherpesvirus 4]
MVPHQGSQPIMGGWVVDSLSGTPPWLSDSVTMETISINCSLGDIPKNFSPQTHHLFVWLGSQCCFMICVRQIWFIELLVTFLGLGSWGKNVGLSFWKFFSVLHTGTAYVLPTAL